MRRLLLVALGLGFVGAGLYLAGRAPSTYVLEMECGRFEELRRSRYTLLVFQRSRAGPKEVEELNGQIEAFLRETRRSEIRGWEVVLVPAGALPPGEGFAVAARCDPANASDPPPLRGTMEAWIAPKGFLARLFARR